MPLVNDGVLHHMLDLDSPRLGCFDAPDQDGLKELAAVFVAGALW